MKLIVGLGNPGQKYANTRHNVGYMIVDQILEDILPIEKTFWDENGKEKSLTKRVVMKEQEVLLVKPITFMNLSGEPVVSLIKKYSLKVEDIYIIHDDLDLPFGHIKVRFGGGYGGHNGVKSIIESLGTDSFLRIRVGIGRPERVERSAEDYVLEQFNSHEIGELKHVIKEAIKTINLILKEGIEMYMSKYNRKRLATSD